MGRDYIEFESKIPLHAGDGVVFDTGGDTDREQGGRIFEVRGRRLFFQHGHIDFTQLRPGHRVWKTDDPALDKRLRQSFAGRAEPRKREPLHLTVRGAAGEPLTIEAVSVVVSSGVPLQAAHTAPLTTEKLREHLGRFGDTRYELGELRNELTGAVILPIGELNRLRRELVFRLENQEPRPESKVTWRELFDAAEPPVRETPPSPQLTVLCRSVEQMQAVLSAGARTVYLDFEDIRRYRDAVAAARALGDAEVFLATPRIQKAGEEGFFQLIENAAPDGVLIRNLGAIDFFRERTLRRIGDFSLNVANPLTAQHFLALGLERVTICYDLNLEQVLELLAEAPPAWFELTLHQHMPMFHMEHCVFAAFLSQGSSHLDCGRPCDRHRVHLRDRVGMEHPLRADVGCRNTLFNAVAQTGAQFYQALESAGLRWFRLELLEETPSEAEQLVRAYQTLLSGAQAGENLWRTLRAQSQLGVTRGTL